MTDETQRKRLVARAFDRAASTYDTVVGSYFSFFGPRLVERANISEGATVLDVACGKGAALIPAAEMCGPSGLALGADISSEMVRSAGARGAELGIGNLYVAVMDADHLAAPDGRFDALTCAFSMHFFADPAETVVGFARCVRPGGFVAISEWGEDDERWAWESELIADLGIKGVTTSSVESPDELASLLSRAGLQDVRTETDRFDVTLADEDEWWTWKWSYSFRHVLEQLDPSALESFKEEAYTHVRAMGEGGRIPLTLTANVATGRKPD